MFRRVLSTVLCVSLMALSPLTFAQKKADGESSASGPKKHLTTIVFSGLAGAILGLSTLSFYGRPQDKLTNIAVGFAIGVIGGTAYSTFKAATEPHDFYGLEDAKNRALTRAEIFPREIEEGYVPKLGYTYSF